MRARGLATCDWTAECIDTTGSLTRVWPTGWDGNPYAIGIGCDLDIDECSLGTDNCSANASCIDVPGSCGRTCDAGYTGTCTMVYDLATSKYSTWDTVLGAGNVAYAGDGAGPPVFGSIAVRVPASSGVLVNGTAAVLAYAVSVQDHQVLPATGYVDADLDMSAGDGTSEVATGTFVSGASSTLPFRDCTLPAGTNTQPASYGISSKYAPDDVGTGLGCLRPVHEVGSYFCLDDQVLDSGCMNFGGFGDGERRAVDDTWEEPTSDSMAALSASGAAGFESTG